MFETGTHKQKIYKQRVEEHKRNENKENKDERSCVEKESRLRHVSKSNKWTIKQPLEIISSAILTKMENERFR